ncbi:MAG: carboxypeptidase-like regulatory domain-containing protein, partial [Planctomycetota bacterium]
RRTAVDAPAPEAKGRVNAIEVHARWRGTTEPAAGIPFTLLIQSEDWLAGVVTDDEGKATFDLDRIAGVGQRELASVSIACTFQPGRCHNVELAGDADSPRIVGVELDDGRRVSGIVVDAGGVAVAGALVWLTFDEFQPATVVARTDPAGRFALRGLSHEFSIRATHAAKASADVVAASLVGEREVVLRLGADAARLQVLVTDPAGQPLDAAAVHLDDRNRSANHRHFAVTGTDGRASLDGIAPGKYQLEVAHPSFPPAQVDIVIAGPTEERRETVKLGASADLDGRVRHANGEPVAGASVSVGYDAGSMLQRTTHTGQDGKFRFRGLAVGRHWLWITQTVPDIRHVIELHAGPQELEITAPGSRRIVGQLVDPEGRPLHGWNVLARGISDFTPLGAATDRDGRFAFDGLSERPYLLEVSQDHRAAATFLDIRTDGREQVYRLPANALPRAFLVGRVDGPPDCTLVIARRIKIGEQDTAYLAVPADGRFEFGPMPPVAYDVGLQPAGGNRTWWFATADLGAIDRCDLGTIRVPQPGRLEVTVRDDLGCKELRVGVRPVILGGARGQGLERIDRDHWRASDLPPGEYDVYLSDDATAPVMQRVTIEPAHSTTVSLATTPGVGLAYRLVPPGGTPWHAIGWQMISIRAADGRLVWDTQLMGALAHKLRLLAGSYNFEITTGGGFRGNASVVVPPADGAEVQIPITR